jgi:hypothetical protein
LALRGFRLLRGVSQEVFEIVSKINIHR